MPSFAALLRALLLALLLCAPVGAAIETDHLERSVVRVVIFVQDADGNVFTVGHGSGFAVSPTEVVTNAHVVDAANEYKDQGRTGIIVVPSRGKDFAIGDVENVSEDADLALIKLRKATLPRVTLFAGTVSPDTDVVALGYPGNVDRALGRSADAKVLPSPPERTQARLSSVREGAPWNASLETYLHDARIGPGYSGGPLSDACGRVIGVNSAVTENGEGDAQYAFAIAGPGLRAFLAANNVQYAGTSEPCLDATAAAEARYASDLRQREEAGRKSAEADAREKARQQDLLLRIAERHDTQRRNDFISIALGLLTLGAVGFAGWRFRRRDRLWGAAGAVLALGTAAGIILVERSTPPAVDPNAVIAAAPAASANDAIAPDAAVHCTLDRPSSHITLTDANDSDFRIAGGMCVDGTILYAPTATGLARLSVAKEDESATLSEIDPKTGRYTSSLYLLDQPGFAQVSRLADQAGAPACHGAADPEAALRMGQLVTAARPLLPAQPTQTIAWNCTGKGR